MSAPAPSELAVPHERRSFATRLLSGPAFPHLTASLAARSLGAKPLRVGTTVLVVAHQQVTEALRRDLDFRIAPVNAARIADVDDAFVLGMDRSAVLAHERGALYRALAAVDMEPIRRVATDAAQRATDAMSVDVVGRFARPIAARTAQQIFGVTGPDDESFQAVVRSIFCHTFLNLANDAQVRARALAAAALLKQWLTDEIARRERDGDLGADMMGALLSGGELDADGVRRTLAGMLVGAVDTTASAVAKIVAMLGRDKALAEAVAADADDPERLNGWCLDVLRSWPHNPVLFRRAQVDTSLGETAILAGDRVILWTEAAMQDASAFPEPGRIRPDRPRDRYLHFGGSLHACAGRAVNGWQIPLLVGALLRRGIASVGAIDWAGPFPDHLEVRFAS